MIYNLATPPTSEIYSMAPLWGPRDPCGGSEDAIVTRPLIRRGDTCMKYNSTPALRSSQLRWAIADSAVVPPPPSSTTSPLLLDTGPERQTPSLIPNLGPDHMLADRLGV